MITFLPQRRHLALGVAIQPDGKIVVVGQANVVRYLPDGTLDQSFGTNGKATPTPADGRARQRAPLPNGQILIGYGEGVDALNSDGSIDMTFGVNGVATGSFTGYSGEYFSRMRSSPTARSWRPGLVEDANSIDLDGRRSGSPPMARSMPRSAQAA